MDLTTKININIKMKRQGILSYSQRKGQDVIILLHIRVLHVKDALLFTILICYWTTEGQNHCFSQLLQDSSR